MTSYLGDGIYIKEYDETIVLYTYDGYKEMNHIYFGPNELASLWLWVNRFKEKEREERGEI